MAPRAAESQPLRGFAKQGERCGGMQVTMSDAACCRWAAQRSRWHMLQAYWARVTSSQSAAATSRKLTASYGSLV